MDEYSNEVVIMHCGHPASGQDGEGRPICKSCSKLGALVTGWDRVNEGLSLAGRESVCWLCGLTQDSSADLHCFAYRKDMHMDVHVCDNCREEIRTKSQ